MPTTTGKRFHGINSCTRCSKAISINDPDGYAYIGNILYCNDCFKDLAPRANPYALKIECERCKCQLEPDDWACIQNGHIFCADCYAVLSAKPVEQQADWLKLASDYAKLKMTLKRISVINPDTIETLQAIAQRAIDETL